jgi:predicted ArsR family transcriptional regulator
LTVADVSRELGGSDATVRKVLDQLVTEDVVDNTGPDPDYNGHGRAPLLFRRV